jgi:hypothetical protein
MVATPAMVGLLERILNHRPRCVGILSQDENKAPVLTLSDGLRGVRPMRITRRWPRDIALALVGVVLLPIAVNMVGQFFISWAEEKGWYARPAEKMDVMMGWVSALVASSWFHWIGGIIIGFAVGVWIDATLKRREEATETLVARPGPEKLSPAEEHDARQFRLELCRFVLTNLDQAHTGLINLANWLINVRFANTRSPAMNLRIHLGEIAHDKSLDLVFFELKREAEPNTDILTFQSHIVAYLRLYRSLQTTVNIQTGAFPIPEKDRPPLNRWLEADERCLRAFKDIKAHPAVSADLRSLGDNVFAAGGQWTR